jgi:hypothetical protein
LGAASILKSIGSIEPTGSISFNRSGCESYRGRIADATRIHQLARKSGLHECLTPS